MEDGLSLKRIKHLFFEYNGRIGIKTFVLSSLIIGFISSIVNMFVDFSLHIVMDNTFWYPQSFVGSIIQGLILFFIFLWPNSALFVKRFHDAGFSGWNFLAVLIPILGWFYIFAIAFFFSGDRNVNTYGPVPYRGLKNVGKLSFISVFFGFSGRLRRRDYIACVLLADIILVYATFGVGILQSIFLTIVMTAAKENGEQIADPIYRNTSTMLGFFIIMFMYTIVIYIYTWIRYALYAKRLHDISISDNSWQFSMPMIPFIGWIYAFFVGWFSEGVRGENRYGPDPR